MRVVAVTVLIFAATTAPAFAEQPIQSVQGVVRDSADRPIGGAEVLVGKRHRSPFAW